LTAIAHSIIGLVPIATTPALAILCGNFIWLQEPFDPETNEAKIDKRNADVSKQSRPLLGIPIILNMTPSSTPQTWVGYVYNAEDGKTYSGSFTPTGANTAKLKGCVLDGLICKAQQ
jgi:uncharacterized protein (DUF2147 family)